MTRWTRVWLGGFAAFGTSVAHQLAYWLAAPDPHARAELLHATGHRHWDLFVSLATGALVAAATGFVLTRMTSRTRPAARPHRLCGYAASRLIGLQCVAFVVLEGAERVLVSGDGHAIGAHVVAIGLMVQVLVALAIAGFLTVLARAVDFITRVRSLPCPRAAAPVGRACSSAMRPPIRLARGGRTLRGPPAQACNA